MSDNGASPNGLSAIARLKQKSEQRYLPQPLEIEGDTFYFRRLDGFQLDKLVKLQSDEPSISTARYNAEAVAMSFVSDTGTALTPQEVLAVGPFFYNPAAEFVFRITSDYRVEEGAGTADEPDPFITKPMLSMVSPPPSTKPSGKSATSSTPTR
jgi:hypothetical protein